VDDCPPLRDRTTQSGTGNTRGEGDWARLRNQIETRRRLLLLGTAGHDLSAIFADRRVFFRRVLFLRTHPDDTTVYVAGSAAPAERPTTRGRRSQ